jgi:hypothetical protein
MVERFQTDVKNDGLRRYFFYENGNHWRETIAALEAIGSDEIAGTLRKAAALFGKNGPPTDLDSRGEQLSAIIHKMRLPLLRWIENIFSLRK